MIADTSKKFYFYSPVGSSKSESNFESYLPIPTTGESGMQNFEVSSDSTNWSQLLVTGHNAYILLCFFSFCHRTTRSLKPKVINITCTCTFIVNSFKTFLRSLKTCSKQIFITYLSLLCTITLIWFDEGNLFTQIKVKFT